MLTNYFYRDLSFLLRLLGESKGCTAREEVAVVNVEMPQPSPVVREPVVKNVNVECNITRKLSLSSPISPPKAVSLGSDSSLASIVSLVSPKFEWEIRDAASRVYEGKYFKI
ncbi:unnamed protein product [Orchesella dallaii]|uniref:Uncharacterized protein n=1 Tax=Orchesella dallaii TaxID=48710 RepID=A0ABP1S7D4_9HEXA